MSKLSLLAELIVGLAIIFFVPRCIKWMIDFRKKSNSQILKFAINYWQWVLDKKVLQLLGIVWIVLSIIIFLVQK